MKGDYTEIAPDAGGKWRWHRKAANHRIIATSGESFDSKYNAERAAERAYPSVEPNPPIPAPIPDPVPIEDGVPLSKALLMIFGSLAGVLIGWIIWHGTHTVVVHDTTTSSSLIPPVSITRESTSTTTSVPATAPTTSTAAPAAAGTVPQTG